MRHAIALRVGPAGFRIGSDWRAPIAALEAVYRDYPRCDVPDLTIRLRAAHWSRRWWRPSVAIDGDVTLPEAAPLPLAQGLLAAEMAMNLAMALGWRRHLLLHAGTVARDGRALVMTGESGAGKSTLTVMLAARGWQFLGDEFALIDPDSGAAEPFPRPASLKNASIALATGRLGPLLTGTPKGDIRHWIPPAIATEPAMPALLLFPRYGADRAIRPVAPSEAFVRLTQASTNYVALGESGFNALTRLVNSVPAMAIDYPDTATGLALVDQLWR